MLANVGLSEVEVRRLRHEYEDSDNLESLRNLSGRGKIFNGWRRQVEEAGWEALQANRIAWKNTKIAGYKRQRGEGYKGIFK